MSGSNALTFGVPTIASSGPPQVFNALGAITAANTAASGLYDLRAKQATEAAGNAFLNSIDKTTGLPNQTLLLQNLANDRRTAMAAQTTASAGQTLDHNTFVTTMARLTGASNSAMALVAQHPNGQVPKEAIDAEIDAQGARLGMSPQQIAQAKSQFGADGAANYATILRNHAANLSAQQALLATRPTPGTIDTGQHTIGTQAPPQLSTEQPGAIRPVGTPIVTGLPTRTTLGTKVTWNDVNNVPHETTWEDYATARNSGLTTQDPISVRTQPAAPARPAAPAAPAVAPPPPTNTTVRPSPAVAPPPAAAPAAPAAAAPPSRFSDTTAPSPAAAAAALKTAEGSAAAGEALTARGDQAPTNKANYANMLVDLEKIPTMGPGTEREAYVNSLLQKWTGTSLGTMTAEQIAAADNFAKLANIAVGQQLAAIGGTDARQALFMGSNPRLDLSKLSNRQITNMLNGNEDAIQAKSRAWQEWLASGNGSHTYGRFQDDFNHHFDPRVFQQQYMGPDEIAALKKSMIRPDGTLTGEGVKFRDDVRYAREKKWIP